MPDFYRMQVFAGLVLIFVVLDTVLLVERGSQPRGEMLGVLPWIVFPAQITLLAMWMSWPMPPQTTPAAAKPEERADRPSQARRRSRNRRTYPVNLARFGLGAVGILIVGGAFVIADRSRSSWQLVVPVIGVQLAVILTLMRTVPLFMRTRQFRLWDLLVVVTVVAATAGLVRFVSTNQVSQESPAGVTVMAAFHSVFSLAILAGLAVPGKRVLYLGVPLALGAISLLLLPLVGILAIVTANDRWAGLVVLLLTVASLIQTALVFGALVLLRVCGVFGVEVVSKPEERRSLLSSPGEI